MGEESGVFFGSEFGPWTPKWFRAQAQRNRSALLDGSPASWWWAGRRVLKPSAGRGGKLHAWPAAP